MTSKPEQPVDDRLLHAHDLALRALHEITPADTVGPPADYLLEDGGVVSLRFHTRLLGYPGWYWTVSVAVVDDAEPTVLEAELMPGDGALLAPDWVPWATRLADYQAAQAAAETDDSDDDIDDIDDEDDLDADGDEDDEDEDADEDDDEPKARFHAGDLDGVDIDELDPTDAGVGDAGSDEQDDAEHDDESGDDDPERDDEDERERSY